MTRTEIIDAAKQIVIGAGPSIALEFTGEIITRYQNLREGDPGYERLYAEVTRQAVRVYRFLGHEAPFGLGKGAVR